MNYLVDITFHGYSQMLLKAVVFLALSGFLIYAFDFLLSKFLYKKKPIRVDYALQLSLLWSMALFMTVFAVYLFWLLYENSFQGLIMKPWLLLLGIGHLIVVYVSVVVLFAIQYRKYMKEIK